MRKILHWLTYPWAPMSANQNVPAVSNWAWIPRPISIWQNTGSQKPRSFWKRRTSLSEILPPLLGFTKWATLESASKKKRAVLQRLIGKWWTTLNMRLQHHTVWNSGLLPIKFLCVTLWHMSIYSRHIFTCIQQAAILLFWNIAACVLLYRNLSHQGASKNAVVVIW